MKQREIILNRWILAVAKQHYHNERKRKYPLDYYLDSFMLMRTDLNRWVALTHCKGGAKPYHWKSIYNEFNRWSRDGVFEEAFRKFVSSTYYKHTQMRQRKHLDLFIDVTKITNAGGTENVAMNNEYTKRNVTPLTVLCDENKLPLSLTALPINQTYKNGRRTCAHDVRGIQHSLDALAIIVPNYVKCRVIGDKGYITSKIFRTNGNSVDVIAPNRKNQSVRTSAFAKKKLNGRYKIENLFATLKSSARVNVRSESSLRNYLSFVFMAFLSIHVNYFHS